MAWNIWGVGGIAPIFQNFGRIGGTGTPPIEGIGPALADGLKTSLLLSNNQLPQTGATAVGLLMSFDL